MLGAIIGDLAGSSYEVEEVLYWKKNHLPRPYDERIKIMDKTVPLFSPNSSFTDDTSWTCAIYDAIINGDFEYEKYLREYGMRDLNKGQDIYGRSRFGRGSVEWLKGNYQGESYGNGAAMRISPIGFCFDSFEQIKEESYKATVPSHNNIEAIKSAEAVAVAIYLLRDGMERCDLKDYIESNYYKLDFDLEELRHNYTFTSRAKDSVPQAFFIFFSSNDFEDAIRKAISIGGDTDTIASITGALAEAYYGVPLELKEKLAALLDEDTYNLLKNRYFKQKEYELKG